MTIQAPNWYKEKIRAMVRMRYQSMGGFLDGTMSRGDGGAGVIKFPRCGRIDAYEISGAIQKINAKRQSHVQAQAQALKKDLSKDQGMTR